METTQTQAPQKKSGLGFIVGIFAIIGGVTILGFTILIIGILAFYGEEGVPGNTILEIDFERGFIDDIPDDPVAIAMLGSNLIVRDVLDALEKAKNDSRVTALIAKIGAGSISLAHIQEFRDAIADFRSSGKPAIAWSETFGEFGPGNGAYYLATAFDEIYLQPSGDLGLTGLMSEGMFFKGVLDKLGIVPRGDRRMEYKSAFNQFTETGYTEFHREATSKVINSQFGQIVRGIAESRGFSESEVRDLIDRGPFLGYEALDENLVDGIAYRDEVYDIVRSRVDEDAELLYLSKYLKRAGRPNNKGTGVALIYGVGAISRGASGFDPLFSEPSMGSESVAKAFRTAVDDDDIEAILFRVDSPGGSYNASDIIWREVILAREKGKPVIVSMGGVAGSGGYFVAIPANKIVAQPGTVTGSIGVLSVKLLLNGMWEKIGLSWDEIHTSENGTVWSSNHDYTPAQWERFQTWLDRVYADFTTKVADGRNMSLEKVAEVAKGRIWSGEDALELGLVDELGGYATALRLIREALDLEEDAPIKLRVIPKSKSWFEMLLQESPDNSEKSAAMSILIRTMEALQPITSLIKELGLSNGENILMMPGIDKIR